ncbi:MAG: hypothetical protein RIR11_613 [Bacteroidota bacterium]|jgi:hypothetical protein
MRHLITIALLAPIWLFAQPNYALYDSLLQKYVSNNGDVKYKALQAERAILDSVVAQFQAIAPQKEWSKNERLAYWINAYNLFTVQLIVNNYPVKKITNLDGGKTWDIKRIEIDGKKYSLNQIENEILRPQFKDARIHFAINCAAESCPPLHNRAFTAENVQSLLDKRTRKFIRSSANTLTESNIKISKIFDWYSSDFGDIVTFLNKYAAVKIKTDAKVEYKEYIWNINE